MIADSKRVDPRLLDDAQLVAEMRRRGFEVGPSGCFSRLARELEKSERDCGRISRMVLNEVMEEQGG